MKTDAIAMLIAVLMLFALHCDGAFFQGSSAGGHLTSTNTAILQPITNELTVCLWHSQAAIAPNGGGFVSKVGTQFTLKDSSTGLFDFLYLPVTGGASEHWRSTEKYNSTNNIKFLALTFRFGTGSSITVYSNMLSFGGSWIAGDGNKLGTNVVGNAFIASHVGGGRFLGYYSEVYIWNSILTRQQLDLIFKSKMKGIGKQINPSTLKLYCAIDAVPDGKPIPGDQTIFRDRSGNNVDFRWNSVDAPGQAGMAERVCSYQPNE